MRSVQAAKLPRITCLGFKVSSDGDGWYDGVKRVDELQAKYGFGQEIKELFYELLKDGYCVSSDSKRLALVDDILKKERWNIL